jgi:hypothetical protein
MFVKLVIVNQLLTDLLDYSVQEVEEMLMKNTLFETLGPHNFEKTRYLYIKFITDPDNNVNHTVLDINHVLVKKNKELV